MEQYNGKSVWKGIAIGEIRVLRKTSETIAKYKIEDERNEIERVRKACEIAIYQLTDLYEKAKTQVGETNAAIFETYQMMLEDEGYLDAVERMISQEQVNAEYAVEQIGERFAAMFAAMDDEYMRDRATDMRELSNRVIRILCGAKDVDEDLSEPVILIADDLTPSQTIQMDKKHILAFVTVHGSVNSHAAILARIMNIPAMIGVDVDLNRLCDGTPAIVDSIAEQFILEPTEEMVKEAEARSREEVQGHKQMEALKGLDNVTLGGKRIDIFANISDISDLDSVLEHDAGGIGLFRSEFLYLGRNSFPTEEEQLAAYRKVLKTMGQKKVIIRTLDIGADKTAEYFQLEQEANPALGYRAIRICLTQKEVFKTQLRALLRAAISGNLSIMYPMITSVEEVMQIKEIVNEVRQELDSEGISYRIPEQGIMIETPAAVMISDELAACVDFFSIGTNDLTQFTLAIDRQNKKLEPFYNPHHKAILTMIKMVVDNAHKYGKWTGICGELGADLELTRTFIEMGVDELSVAPSMILRLRNEIRNLDS